MSFDLAHRFPLVAFHWAVRRGRLDRERLGWLGECHVARLARKRGWRVLGRRLVLPAGEVDLLLRWQQVPVLVEVKSALVPDGWTLPGGAPWSEEIRPGRHFDARQWRAYERAARQVRRRLETESQGPVRIDLVEVLWHPRWRRPVVLHHRDLHGPGCHG
ncbi:MAG: YraN family protein [Planctomycetota bacterium]